MDRNIREGLEDNSYLRRGDLTTNPHLIERTVLIIRELGFEPVSSEMLSERPGLNTLDRTR